MKEILIVGNWKMNKGILEALEYAKIFKEIFRPDPKKEVVLCPPYIDLPILADVFKETEVKLGAQNIFWEKEGSFTGEISASMLKGLADFVLLGHSERRKHLQETSEEVVLKAEAASLNNLIPIVCVSDLAQVKTLAVEQAESLVIAFEPLFAVGAKEADSPEHAEQMTARIREILEKKIRNLKVLYGGSVNPRNVNSFMKQPNIDGVLPGRASLDPRIFWELIKNA